MKLPEIFCFTPLRRIAVRNSAKSLQTTYVRLKLMHASGLTPINPDRLSLKQDIDSLERLLTRRWITEKEAVDALVGTGNWTRFVAEFLKAS